MDFYACGLYVIYWHRFCIFLSGVGNAVFLLRHSLKPELRNPLRAGLAAAVFAWELWA